jgi:hypothetical protein
VQSTWMNKRTPIGILGPSLHLPRRPARESEQTDACTHHAAHQHFACILLVRTVATV